jgi:hypothetical protein
MTLVMVRGQAATFTLFPLGQRVGSVALGEIAADTDATLSRVKSAFEQEGGALTGLQRATAPSGRLTE